MHGCPAGLGEVSLHTALPSPLCPGPRAAGIPRARGPGQRRRDDQPQAGARRVRLPGRSLSYCSLCCTHPVEKSQMSARRAAERHGGFERGLQVAGAWERRDEVVGDEAESITRLRRWHGRTSVCPTQQISFPLYLPGFHLGFQNGAGK